MKTLNFVFLFCFLMASCGQSVSERSRTDPLYFLSSDDHKTLAAWEVTGWMEANSHNDSERVRLGRFVLDRLEKEGDAENTFVLLHYAFFLEAEIRTQDEEQLRKAVARANRLFPAGESGWKLDKTDGKLVLIAFVARK